MASYRSVAAVIAFTSGFVASGNVAIAQNRSDLSIALKSCALSGNRLTVALELKNNSPYRIYLAQVNDGNDAHGDTSEGGMLYIVNVSGVQTCHGDTHNCQNNSIINDVNELSYIDPGSSVRDAVTFLDGTHAKIDPSDQASVPVAFMVRKARDHGEDVPGTAPQPPGRPFVVRTSLPEITVAQCR